MWTSHDCMYLAFHVSFLMGTDWKFKWQLIENWHLLALIEFEQNIFKHETLQDEKEQNK